MKHYFFIDSKLNKYLRKKFGIDKPYALEMGGWQKWEDKLRAEKPFAHFITETIPDFLDDIHYSITNIWNRPKYYIRHRFIEKLHVLQTGLEKGQWWDCDSRMSAALRELLIWHVEHELAWSNTYNKTWKFVNDRCPEAGLDYLDWASKLINNDDYMDKDHELYGKPTHQAIAAMEIRELYNWCKNVYPNRADPHDISGWSEHCELMRQARPDEKMWVFSGERTEEERERGRITLDKCHEIEKQYHEEETEMLCRIIKVRESMWT